MKMYEYHTIYLHLDIYSNEDIQKDLNDLGKGGWELINTVNYASYYPLLIFKREVKVNKGD